MEMTFELSAIERTGCGRTEFRSKPRDNIRPGSVDADAPAPRACLGWNQRSEGTWWHHNRASAMTEFMS